MISSANDAHKATQIRSKFGELSVRLDPAMVQTFKRWFPALAGCTKQYARFMKAAATNERRLVAESMEQFAQGKAPGTPSLTQWWSVMQQQFAFFGCNGCAVLAMRPKTPASSQNVGQPCREDIMPILLTASFVDDKAWLKPKKRWRELSEEDETALDADIVVPVTRIVGASRPIYRSGEG